MEAVIRTREMVPERHLEVRVKVKRGLSAGKGLQKPTADFKGAEVKEESFPHGLIMGM